MSDVVVGPSGSGGAEPRGQRWAGRVRRRRGRVSLPYEAANTESMSDYSSPTSGSAAHAQTPAPVRPDAVAVVLRRAAHHRRWPRAPALGGREIGPALDVAVSRSGRVTSWLPPHRGGSIRAPESCEQLRRGQRDPSSGGRGTGSALEYAQRTGRRQARAAGSEGPVRDHYSAAAEKAHLRGSVIDARRRAASRPILFCDSLEVYGADWTRDSPRVRPRPRVTLSGPLPALDGRSGWAQCAGLTARWPSSTRTFRRGVPPWRKRGGWSDPELGTQPATSAVPVRRLRGEVGVEGITPAEGITARTSMPRVKYAEVWTW